MAIDVTALIVLALFFFKGYTKGLIVAVFSAIAILLGLVCALKLSHQFAAWLLAKGYTTVVWAPLLSFILLFVGVGLLVQLGAKLLQSFAKGIMLGGVNKVIGGMLYTAVGIVFFSILLWIGVRMGTITPTITNSSVSYPFFVKVAPAIFSLIGDVIPTVKEIFGGLNGFFDSATSQPRGQR
jgi:membrane protein required for colicin V production